MPKKRARAAAEEEEQEGGGAAASGDSGAADEGASTVSFLDSSCGVWRGGAFTGGGLVGHLAADGILPPEALQRLTVALGARYDTGFTLDFGTDAELWQTKKAPAVGWRLPEGAPAPTPPPSAHLYALLLVDPDAPDRLAPTERCRVQWLVVDIPWASGDEARAQAGAPAGGHVVAPYVAPNPAKSLHRFVLLLARQAAGARLADAPAVNPPPPRTNFDLPAFLADTGCTLVGLNFFALHPETPSSAPTT
jgi:hypothetical protein